MENKNEDQAKELARKKEIDLWLVDVFIMLYDYSFAWFRSFVFGFIFQFAWARIVVESGYRVPVISRLTFTWALFCLWLLLRHLSKVFFSGLNTVIPKILIEVDSVTGKPKIISREEKQSDT